MRIRTVKPEWLTDGRLSECSLAARVLSVGLLLHADDEGRGRITRATPYEIFPGESNPAKTFEAALEELSFFCTVYEQNHDRLFEISNFAKHQRINRPTKSKIPPPPPPDQKGLTEGSLRTHGGFTGGKGKGKGKGRGSSSLRELVGSADAVRDVFDFWAAETGRNPKVVKLTKTRIGKIRARLRTDGYTVDQLKDAVRGAKLSPHHRGENEHGTDYLWPETIFRDSGTVEAHITRLGNPKRGAEAWGDPDYYPEADNIEEIFGGTRGALDGLKVDKS